MCALAALPSSVPSLTLARSISPVEMNGRPEVFAQAIGLGPLSGTRRPNQDQVELGGMGG